MRGLTDEERTFLRGLLGMGIGDEIGTESDIRPMVDRLVRRGLVIITRDDPDQLAIGTCEMTLLALRADTADFAGRVKAR